MPKFLQVEDGEYIQSQFLHKVMTVSRMQFCRCLFSSYFLSSTANILNALRNCSQLSFTTVRIKVKINLSVISIYMANKLVMSNNSTQGKCV